MGNVTTTSDQRVAGRTQRAGWIRTALVGVCVLTVSAAARCGAHPGAPRTAATLQFGVSLPRAGTGIGIESFVTGLTREPVVGIGRDGRPTPKLAEEWGTLEAGAGIWLRLHPKLRLHDGTEATASLVRDALKRNASDPQRPLSYASITEIVANNETRTLEIHLSRPEAFLLSDLVETTLDGTGPFRVIDRNERVRRLEAFQDYYRGRPQIDLIEVKPYETQRKAWAAFMRGEIDAVHDVSPAAIDFVEQESSVRTYRFLRAYYTFLAFNTRHPVLARADVRRALSQAVNREEIVTRALRGRAQPADGPIWPHHWAYSTGQKVHAHNPDAARILLDAAGLKNPSSRELGRMPSRLRFKCLIWTNDARFESIALVMQKQFFDIGVEMEIEAVPVSQFVERMRDGRFDTLLMEFNSGRSISWVYAAFHSSHPILNSPLTGYHAADELLDRLRRSASDQETRETVGELQRRFYEDPPGIFLAWPFVSRAVSTAFSVPQEANTDILGNVWEWRAQPQLARR